MEKSINIRKNYIRMIFTPIFLVMICYGVTYGELVNIAPLYGTVTADSSWSERPAYLAIDGDSSPSQSQWSAGDWASPENPHWLIVDLQNNYPISQIIVCGFPFVPGDYYWGYTNYYNLYTSTNGIDWVLIGSDWWAEDNDPAIYSDTFVFNDKPLIRYVKYEVIGGTHWAGLQELMIYTDNVSYYNFIGFLSPVENPQVVNVGKAGRTYPIKWQLKDYSGNFISDLSVVKSMQYYQTSTDASSPSDIMPETSGSSGLHYDSTSNQYVFNWKTPKTLLGDYVFTLTLNDGTQHEALFRFTK
jgi:hypothetical protein